MIGNRLETSERIILFIGVLVMAGMCFWALWGNRAQINFSRLALQEIAVAGATVAIAFLGVPLGRQLIESERDKYGWQPRDKCSDQPAESDRRLDL